MGLFAEFLDVLYDVRYRYCIDCDKDFKTKKQGLLAGAWDRPLVKNCIYCGSENTYNGDRNTYKIKEVEKEKK